MNANKVFVKDDQGNETTVDGYFIGPNGTFLLQMVGNNSTNEMVYNMQAHPVNSVFIQKVVVPAESENRGEVQSASTVNHVKPMPHVAPNAPNATNQQIFENQRENINNDVFPREIIQPRPGCSRESDFIPPFIPYAHLGPMQNIAHPPCCCPFSYIPPERRALPAAEATRLNGATRGRAPRMPKMQTRPLNLSAKRKRTSFKACFNPFPPDIPTFRPPYIPPEQRRMSAEEANELLRTMGQTIRNPRRLTKEDEKFLSPRQN